MATGTGAVAIDESRAQDAAVVLAGAFLDDPLIQYIFPEALHRRSRLIWSMRTMIGSGLRNGSVYATAGAVEGVSLWFRPGYRATFGGMVADGLLFAPIRIGLDSVRRFLRVVKCLEEIEVREVPGPFWHLFWIGVSPAARGRGVGGSLLAPGIAAAEAAGLPCYLQNSKERNLPFYTRHGFQVVGKHRVPADGPIMWTMRRDPRPMPAA